MSASSRCSRTTAIVASCLAVGALAACSGGGASSSSPHPLPPTTAASTTAPPTVTTPQGGPALTMFNAPSSYTCLTQDPTQAQVTFGWSAPSATQVVVTLDGTQPPRGVRAALPYQVPAGPATGPGVTIVFACGTAPHSIELRWERQHAAATVRDVSVVSAP